MGKRVSLGHTEALPPSCITAKGWGLRPLQLGRRAGPTCRGLAVWGRSRCGHALRHTSQQAGAVQPFGWSYQGVNPASALVSD